jgi:hypothetical protein
MKTNDPKMPDLLVGLPDYSSSLKLPVLPMEDKTVHYPSMGSTPAMRLHAMNSGFDQLLLQANDTHCPRLGGFPGVRISGYKMGDSGTQTGHDELSAMRRNCHIAPRNESQDLAELGTTEQPYFRVTALRRREVIVEITAYTA